MKKQMTKRFRDSVVLAFAFITGLSTLFTILGVSMKEILPLSNIKCNILIIALRVLALLVLFIVLSFSIWIIKGLKYRNTITLKIGNNDVTIKFGNIFKQDAWRVIAMDTHFDTTVDDVVISKSSLHGQLVLNHGDAESIYTVLKKEADRRNIGPDENGRFSFPLGTAIHYEGKDGHYILVAFTDLDSNFEAHTDMVQYEVTLMKIWREISRVYAKNDLAIPIIGSGITRFNDSQDDKIMLLRCMLCTLNTSKVHFKSKINIIIYDGNMNNVQNEDKSNKNMCKYSKQNNSAKKSKNMERFSLYEYKDLFRVIK